MANVRTSILQRKAIDWLAQSANITDEKGEAVTFAVPALEDEAQEAIIESDEDEGDFEEEAESGTVALA